MHERGRCSGGCLLANGANGVSDIEGKVAKEAMSECGQRASFKTFGMSAASCSRPPQPAQSLLAAVSGGRRISECLSRRSPAIL